MGEEKSGIIPMLFFVLFMVLALGPIVWPHLR
jgi:hypothetical protein